ncbi:MAG: hypothetical protein E6K81_06930 [Candidatus Eisenbacteria bacterium]|uniref:DUF4175 family protein n=1 Tax=Eiseniibacteriota bacterium TaxID=2212470 RepID=A0A538U9L5_UNCEI|nr:MAG: hypothetical protein E6K81_06930 [Candidatus Eisenbacteria bacterium]
MSERVPDHSLHRILDRHHRAVRRALVTRHGLRGAAAACALVALALAIGVALPLGPEAAWARLLVTLAGIGLAVAAAVRAFRGAMPGFDAWQEGIERHFPELRSWLRNALELQAAPPPDTSPALARALTAETARRLEGVPIATLTPRVEPRRPISTIVSALIAVLALALGLPARTSRSWATLRDPGSAAPPVRLVVEPGSVRLTPGAALAVRARVWGTGQTPRLLRDGGPSPVAFAEGRGERGERIWRFDLTQLTREQRYQVRAASATSPRYLISLAGEPLPVSFEVEYQAPAYARLPVQRGTSTRGDLTALRGTRARMLVTFDRDLASLEAALPDGHVARWTAVTPRRWQGEITVEREGEYGLHAVAGQGEGRFRYRVTPLPDAPPLLAVRLPEGDVDLPAGQQIPLDVLAQDDLGLAQLKLQVRKEADAPWTDLPLARFDAQPREAHVESRWDASPLGLLPGQSASFRFEVTDDNVSGPGRAVSPTFQLRFPSLADLYESLDQKQENAQTSLEKVAEKAKELQQSLDKLSRQPVRPAPQSPQGFERSEEMKSALERQQELGQHIDQAAKELQQSLEQAAERKAFDDQLTRKLQELNDLVQQVQSPEFKDALKRMQEEMEKLDKTALENELPKWREENQKTLANLERTVELIRKLREEERLQALAQRAEELKAQQDQLNQEMDRKAEGKDAKSETGPDADQKLAAKQDQAADETEQLSKDANEAGAQSKEETSKQALDEAAKELKSEAAPAQRDAAKQAQDNQRSQAGKSGKKASESLHKAAQNLRRTVASMQQQEADLDLSAVRRAAQDLVSLQRASDAALKPDAGTPPADRQTDLSEGAARVSDSLFTLARQTPFISPKLSDALGRAVNQLSTSGRELGTGNRSRGEEAGRAAGEALNEAVIELRASEASMCQNPGAGMPGGQQKPGGQKHGESMQRLGQRQGELNQQTKSLAQRLSEQMRMQAGDRGELDRLAQEQARIREQMEEIRRGEEEHKELLGKLDQAQQDMKSVEEALRDGGTDPSIEEKQTRILSRMLDATRSLNRRDFDPERESRPGEDVARVSPAPLPQDMLRETDRLRLGLLKAESDRYPAQYRAFIESYLKSLNGSPR